MELKAYINDIESICRTCDACDSSCAGYTFKNCFESELKIEETLQVFDFVSPEHKTKYIQT